MSLKSKLREGSSVGLLGLSMLSGCGSPARSQPETPSVSVGMPQTPGGLIDATACAANSVISCLQSPPQLEVNKWDALQACVARGDVPVHATCGGVEMNGICHNAIIEGGGFLCQNATAVNCSTISVNISCGQTAGTVEHLPGGRIPTGN